MKKTCSLSLVLLCLTFGACSSSNKTTDTAILTQDSNSLWNLKVGRDFVAQNRFELAKEHFLYALASCNDAATQHMITQELDAVELMIKTQR